MAQVNPFRQLLVRISSNIRPNEWKNCADRFDIQVVRKERFTAGFDFFWWMYENGSIGPKNLDPLKEQLRIETRTDLIAYIEEYESMKNSHLQYVMHNNYF
jgi:hypothetical protein